MAIACAPYAATCATSADGLTLLSAWLNARSEGAPPLPTDDKPVVHAGITL